jgi:hypothetical protein
MHGEAVDLEGQSVVAGEDAQSAECLQAGGELGEAVAAVGVDPPYGPFGVAGKRLKARTGRL